MDDSPLLRLSAELRNRIYEYALRSPEPITLSHDTEPALLRSCNQIRSEARLLFYANNDFTANLIFIDGGAAPLLAWLSPKPKTLLCHIQRINIRIETHRSPVIVSKWRRPNFLRCAEYYCLDLPVMLADFDYGGGNPVHIFRVWCDHMDADTLWSELSREISKTEFLLQNLAWWILLRIALPEAREEWTRPQESYGRFWPMLEELRKAS